MTRLPATQRVRAGRTVALIAAAVFCLTRALAYLPELAPSPLPSSIALITWDGRLLWAWPLAWSLVSLVCMVDLARGSTRWGLGLTVGLMAAWASGYVLHWALYPDSRSWLTAVTYLAPAALVWGLLFKVSALLDLLPPDGPVEGDDE